MVSFHYPDPYLHTAMVSRVKEMVESDIYYTAGVVS